MRASLLIIGGLVVLQGSNQFDVSKIVYLAIAAICVLGSLVTLLRHVGSAESRELRRLLLMSFALAAIIALSLPIAIASGTPLSNWIRDASNYALVAAVPVVAFDAYRSASRRSLLILLLISSGLATVSYVIQWLGLRHILDFPIDRIALPSGQLTSAFFVTVVALSLVAGRWRFLWAMAVGVDMALFVLAGTRSRLPMLALPTAMALVSWPIGVGRLATALAIHVATALVAFTILYGLISASPPAGTPPPPAPGASASPDTAPSPSRPPNSLDNRLGSLPNLITRLGSDPSFRERVAQTYAAWDVFAASPLIGTGPGKEIYWVDYEDKSVASYNLDTPVLVAAKFGLIGVVVALGWTVALLSFVWRMLTRARTSWVTLALAGFSAVAVYSWLFASPYEDKGFAFALIPLVALGLSTLNPLSVPRAQIGADSTAHLI